MKQEKSLKVSNFRNRWLVWITGHKMAVKKPEEKIEYKNGERKGALTDTVLSSP